MQTPRQLVPPPGADIELDADQEAVVGAVLGGPPHVSVAVGGPGTGKTLVAQETVRRFSDNASARRAPDAAVLLAPTRVQANRLAQRLNAQVAGTRTAPLVRTPSSLAFAILRRVAAVRGDPTPRLLTGAEQDVILRELLSGHAADPHGAPPWPEDIRPALDTAGLRGQLRDLLMRAVEHGVDAAAMRELAEVHRRPQWQATAAVLQEYEEVTALASPGAFDPASICVAAADALDGDPELRGALAADLELLVVDDAQELTASAARLIATVAHGSMRVLFVGDGDAVVHGFRGATPHRFLEVAHDIVASRPDHSASMKRLVLRIGHRHPDAVTAVTAAVARRIAVTTGAAHRAPASVGSPGSTDDGDVEVAVLSTGAQEVELVAHRMRRAHLIDAVPWSQMAVIARSGARHAAMRRAFTMAGVPVRQSVLDGPIALDPATRPLLLAYDVVVRWCAGDLTAVTSETVLELVTSPIGRADPVALRRLRRAVRSAHREVAEAVELSGRSVPVDTDALMGEWVLDPAWRSGELAPDADLAPLARVARTLWGGRAAMQDASAGPDPGCSAHALLWAIWHHSALASRWERAAMQGGSSGLRADRDLDAVMVLFGAAERYTERWGRVDPAAFADHLAAQEVSTDSLVAQGTQQEEVAVLTPQAASGGQWRFTVVMGVQEGVWPNLRLRGSLLGGEDLVQVVRGRPIDGAEGLRSAQEHVWNDELRQFYVALTRSSERLLVTAVASVDEQPSAFVHLLDIDGTGWSTPEVPARLTLRGVVADLRRDLLHAHRNGDVATRSRHARELSALAVANVPWADPSSWLDARSVSSHGPRIPAGPVSVSPSTLQTFADCSLRWLLTRHGGEGGSMLSSSIGTLVHGILADHPHDSHAELTAHLHEQWPHIGAGDSWVAARLLSRAQDMVGRYVAYRNHATSQARELIGTELACTVDIGRARLTGRVDRLERTADDAYLVVDLKTGSSKPTAKDIDTHPQLGAYQVAVTEGGFEEVTGPAARSGGAALAHLGKAGVTSGAPQQQNPLSKADDPQWAHTAVSEAAEAMAGAAFPAVRGQWCRTCAVRSCCPLQPEGDHL